MPRRISVAEYWEKIFNDYHVLERIREDGYFKIESDTIKIYKEPRLMTKFDFRDRLPSIFKNNNLSILPIDNGLYIIGDYDLYQKLPNDDIEPIVVNFSNTFQTIDPDCVNSEANALHIAYLSGMFNTMTGDILFPTFSGKMRTTSFSFKVDNNSHTDVSVIKVESPQIEIDAGYEGDRNVLIVEAKNKIPTDFIIRQLYYPLRFWLPRVNKPIKTYFLAYDTGVYHIYDYDFLDKEYYNSLKLVTHKSFVVKYDGAEDSLSSLIESTESEYSDVDDNIPFPQADSFSIVLKTLSALLDGDRTAAEIAEFNEMSSRQGNYYGDACRYLRLADKNGDKYYITKLGKQIMNSELKNRNYKLCQELLKHKVFNEAVKYCYDNNATYIEREKCEAIMRSNNVLHNDAMYQRRSLTVKSWVTWIMNSNI